MNPNHFSDHNGELNRQVNEPIKNKNTGRKELESPSKLIFDEESALETRVQSLKETVSNLKAALQEEKALWKKEVELMTSLLSTGERCQELDFIPEAEGDVKPVTVAGTSDPLTTSPLIRDYEEKLNRYQGALAQAQAEKRMNIRRQIAANTYRKRLNEVEKLCQEELDKVRETATHLEPLKQIASEWGKSMPHYTEPLGIRRRSSSIDCGGDFHPVKRKETQTLEKSKICDEVPVKQIDASLVMDEDVSNEIKGKIVLQIGSLPCEVPTICYSAKFE